MKKLWKKLLAVTTAVMMAITLLPAMANATETEIEPPAPTIDYTKKGSITIKKTTGVKNGEVEALNGAEFTLYRIVELTANSTEESDLAVSVTVGSKTYSKIKDILNLSEAEQKSVASAFASAVTPTQKVGNAIETTTVDGQDGIAKFTNLGVGYYLVVETKTPTDSTGKIQYVASTPFFVAIPQANTTTKFGETATSPTTSWVYDVVATPKNEEVTIGKKISNINNTKTEAKNEQQATVKVGDKVEYTITSISPKYTDEYFAYTDASKLPVYKITDTLSKGLGYQNDISVKIGKTTLKEGTDKDYTLSKTTNENGSMTIIITFTQTFLKNEAHKGKEVTVTYTAEVLQSAEITDPNTNEVRLDYTNKPGEETKGIPGDVPKVYTYALNVHKKDNSGTNLKDAKFKLYFVTKNESGENVYTQIKNLKDMDDNGVIATDSKGNLTLAGLNVGDYALEEVEAPAGYTLLKDKIFFSISDSDIDGRLDEVTEGSTISNVKDKEKNNTGYVQMEVVNNKGFNLPATGGMGTYLFTIGGLVIMAGAALLLIASKKRRA
ncbi:MAG: SpaH/EbpB family LPXTG-anchored major pilin [Eubacterium sp.]|nr:SpaH/EbpB family LPXTG-anchored major pilin [Eubacterium sp.]